MKDIGWTQVSFNFLLLINLCLKTYLIEMIHYTKNQIENLKKEINDFQNVLNESNHWIDKCLKYEDFERADFKVKNEWRIIRKVRQ